MKSNFIFTVQWPRTIKQMKRFLFDVAQVSGQQERERERERGNGMKFKMSLYILAHSKRHRTTFNIQRSFDQLMDCEKTKQEIHSLKLGT